MGRRYCPREKNNVSWERICQECQCLTWDESCSEHKIQCSICYDTGEIEAEWPYVGSVPCAYCNAAKSTSQISCSPTDLHN